MVPALLVLFAAAAGDLDQALRKVAEVYALVESQAAEPANPNLAIFEGAIPAMMRELDPHSVFFPADQFDQLRQMQNSTSRGFGTVVSVLPGRVIVLQAMEGTPSARAGIEPGDEIVAVNGILLDWLEMEQLVQLLGETRRREATLDVRRLGAPRLLRFRLSPEQLEAPPVDRAFLLGPATGYVRVASFDLDTAGRLREAIEKLGGAGLRGLVLDLRGNPGGVVRAAIETAALFLPPGSTVLTVRGRAVQSEETRTPEESQPYGFPLAVLIDARTASAAEIVAGAVQDHGRGVIVGEPSYGKGLVQSVYPLSEGTGMALTTAYYYTPSGRSIQRPLSGVRPGGSQGGGLQPDIIVRPEPPSRLRAALEATGLITSFATVHLRAQPGAGAGAAVSDGLLDEFRTYVSRQNFDPPTAEWAAEREWIRSRLLQEILNQAVGVEAGDRVEMQRDAQVERAVAALGVR